MDFHEAYTDTCSSVGMAARLGNTKSLKKFLDEGKEANVKDNRGWFPLHEAAYFGHADCLDLLLKQEEVDINWKTYEGETALLLACQQGYTECAERLLEAGADKNLSTNEIITPLFEACNYRHLECVKLLLEAGCKVNHHVFTGDTPLHIAIERGCPDIVELLMKHGANICACSDHNLTPVFIAAQYGKADCLKLLLDEAKIQGKQHVVNITASDNASSLLIASQNGHDRCVEMLLDAGADPSLQVHLDGEDVTMDPLQYAAKFGHERCLRLLLQHSRIDPQSYKMNELHPLRLGIDQTDIGCLRLLMENGFKIGHTFYNTSGGYGSLLCFEPSVEAAQFLLENGLELVTWKSEYVPANSYARKELNPLLESFTNENLTDLLLSQGARLQDSVTFWQEIINHEHFRRSLHARTPDRLISNICYFYLMIKYDGKMNTFLTIFLETTFYQSVQSQFWLSIFAMVYLLTLNIRAPPHHWDQLQGMKGYEEDAKILSKVEASSHTLMHACRVKISRHMISLDQWDSEGVKRLGKLPKIIEDYLKFEDCGKYGQCLIRLVPVLRDYFRGRNSKEQTWLLIKRLIDGT